MKKSKLILRVYPTISNYVILGLFSQQMKPFFAFGEKTVRTCALKPWSQGSHRPIVSASWHIISEYASSVLPHTAKKILKNHFVAIVG
jgi:hypothetical protein